MINILTINICTATAPAKLENLRALITSKKADIIMLQEVAVPLFHFAGYAEFVNAGDSKRGTAVLVKEEMEARLLLALPCGRATAVQVGAVTVICVYAPAGSRRRLEREEFFNTGIAPLLAAAGEQLIIGGDFNCVLEDGDNTGGPNASPALARLTRIMQLCDVWPTLREDRGFTFITNNSASRLDRFYCSRSLAPMMQFIETTAAAVSDHLAVSCTLNSARAPPPPRRPKASWSIDPTALKHPDFLPGFAKEWALALPQRAAGESVTEWWLRVAKPLVRTYAAAFTRDLRRDRSNKLAFLHESLQDLCTATPRRAGDATLIKDIKSEILELHAEAMHGVLDRAKMVSALEDEPVSIVHVARMGQRARQQHVETVKDGDGVVHRGQAAVAQHFLSFYREKFSAPPPRDTDAPGLGTLAVDKTVTAEDNEKLCRPFSKEEVLNAVKKSPRRKSPGEDGITAEFYRAAWPVIGDILTEVMNEMWASACVPADIMRGIITLIPKVPQPAVVKDYRPITLLDVDAKILARLLVTRLSVLAGKLLHPNQVRPGGMRTMAAALCDLRDVISAMGSLREAGCVLSVDFSGAFDAVKHDCLFNTLERRGVATRFIDVVKAMYGGATSQLRINGVLTEPFPILRSIRQGCPKSALFFAIVLAPFMYHMEGRLRGMQLADSILRTSAYADDALVVLRDPSEAAVVTNSFKDFAVVSGLVANPQKTAALAAGGWDEGANIGYPYVKEVKVLGVVFGQDVKDTIRINWPRVLQGVRGVLTANAARALTLQQRVGFIKMFALSRMWHVAQVIPLPTAVRKEIEKALRLFLWRGHIFKVKWDVACTPRSTGGLGLPDVENKCAALYAGRWQGILVDDPDCFSAEWLHVLLRTFPLGPARPSVWQHSSHYLAFHKTRTAAAAATPDVPARQAIRNIYDALVASARPPVPSVVAKARSVDWPSVWTNITSAVLPAQVQELWWLAVHDIVPTRAHLHKIGRSDTASCPSCHVTDGMLHRLTACGEARTAWRWLRALVHKVTGQPIAPRALVQPTITTTAPDRTAALLWAMGQTVAYITRAARPTAAGFAHHILTAKSKVASTPHRWPPDLVSGLATWVR